MENQEFREYTYEMKIKEFHLDTFGHVNNAIYLSILEEARWDFVTANGYGLKEVLTLKKGPVVLEVNIKYKKELKNRENIKIISRFGKPDKKIFTINQNIYCGENFSELACEAIITAGFMDLATRKLMMPTPEWFKAVGF